MPRIRAQTRHLLSPGHAAVRCSPQTFTPTPHLDGRHMVFGEAEGDATSQSVLDAVEAVGNPRDGPPLKSITVVDCGQL